MKQQELYDKRAKYNWMTWKHANKKGNISWPKLYDAGELGFTVLHSKKGHWANDWYDKAEKLPDDLQKKLEAMV